MLLAAWFAERRASERLREAEHAGLDDGNEEWDDCYWAATHGYQPMEYFSDGCGVG